MRVLVIRLGAFGDIVHTLPLLSDLFRAGITVDWLVEQRWACLLEGHPFLRRVVSITKSGPGLGPIQRLRQLLAARQRILAGQYDLVIDAQGLAKSCAFAVLSGAPVVVGHGWPRAREGTWIGHLLRSRCDATHVIDQQRALAEVLGISTAGPWRFVFPDWRQQRLGMDAWLTERGLHHPWMLNVGAGWPTKVWPLERQIAFAQAVRAAGHPLVVVWGGKAELAIADQVVAAAPGAHLAPPTTLPELAGLLDRAAVLVSGDTGPLHLAFAQGVPCIGLFGPVPAERNGPVGPGHRTFQAPAAAWERRDVSKVRMGDISHEQVLAAAIERARR